VRVNNFAAVFNNGNGPLGGRHTICSYTWTKGGSQGGLFC
jgi:hypothetical protein